MKECTSEKLLEDIALRDTNQELADKAYAEFYHRYKGYVWSVAYKLAETASGARHEALAKEFMGDTFLDIYLNYGRKSYYRPDPSSKNPEGRVKAWLAGIAKNHLKRHIDFRAKHSNYALFSSKQPCEPFFTLEETKDEFDTPNFLALQEALQEALSDKEREILLITTQFEDKGGIPKDIEDNLCKTYGIMGVTLRKIKQRAKEKIKKYLESRGLLPDTLNQPHDAQQQSIH